MTKKPSSPKATRQLDQSRRQGNQQQLMQQQRQQTHRQWQKIHILCAAGFLLLVAIAVLPRVKTLWQRQPQPRPEIPELSSAQLTTMQRTSGQLLGEYLASRIGEHDMIVLLTPPTAEQSALEAAALTALQQSLAEHAAKLTTVELPANSRGMNGRAPWYTPSAFRLALQDYSAATLIISSVGLPEPLEAFHLWDDDQETAPPPLALLHAPAHRLARVLRAGLISAMVVRRPGMLTASGDETLAPEDPRHWLLLTPENVDTVAQQYTNLFPQ